MSVLLVRHGRTVANAAGELLGRRDPPLDDEGEWQAARLADALLARCDGHTPRVIASPLARAVQTAEVVAARFATAVEIDPRWIELDYGELDGVPVAAVPADTWARWRSDPAFAPPGGETLAALRTRVEAALAEVLAGATGPVVVVSHVSPIKAAVATVLGVGDEVSWRLFLSPASITEVAARPNGAALVGFNEVAHLARGRP
jgi:broad specificity phosphatase PhoE